LQPESQDLIVIAILKYAKAISSIKSGDFAKANKQLTGQKVDGIKRPEQFSSLPGGSEQHVKENEFNVLIKNNISNEVQGNSNIPTKNVSKK
jgi:muramidase (phage lysozyme)